MKPCGAKAGGSRETVEDWPNKFFYCVYICVCVCVCMY